MMDPEQRQLLKAAGGNARALRRIYEQHVDAVHAFVYHRVGCNAAMAEDAVQDTFLRALADAKAFDPARGGLRAWLCETSRNVIRRHVKSAHRLQPLNPEDEAHLRRFARALDGGGAPLADELLSRQEVRLAVATTLNELPEAYRTLLELKYVLDLSIEQLARERGVSADALKSQLARARRAFRDAFLTALPTASEVNDVR
jgi:RNA polymerase sigma-70 factor, ECF subfamily